MNPLLMLPLLRLALRLDGVVSGLAGLLCVLLAAWMAPLFGVATTPMLAVGGFLLIYGSSLLFLARRDTQPQNLVWAIVVGNALWVIGSLALAVSDWIAPSTLGLVLLIGQALAVLIMTEMQYIGLRRSLRAASATVIR